MYKSLLKKFIGFSLGNWITLIISLLTTPIITRIFMPEEYGIFSMYNLVVNLLLIVILMGNDQAYMRFYSEKNKSILFRKVLLGSLFILILISFIIVLFKDSLNLTIVGDRSTDLSYFIIIGLFLQVILRILQTDVRMRQNAMLFSTISVLDKLSNVSITIILARLIGSSYISLVIAFILSNAFIVVLILIIDKNLSYRSEPNESIKYREVVKYGFPFMSSLLVFWVFQSFDKFALKYFSDLEQLGIYAATMKLVLILNIIQNSFMNFWTPVALEKYEDKDNSIDFFRNMFDVVGSVFLLLGIFVVMFSDVAAILLGSVYKETSNVLPYLIFIPILYTVSETTVIGINFSKKTRWHIIIAIIASIVNISLNILLVPILGAKGAALGTAVSYFVFYIIRTYVSKKLFYVNYKISVFNINIILLFAYANFAAFTQFSIWHLLLGIFSIILVLYSYRKSLKKIF